MTTIETVQTVPLTVWDDGSIRVTGSRLTLVHEYKQGATAEQIADSFPPTSLADIHVIIAYYLMHRVEIEEYLRRMEAEADAVQQRIESDPKYQAFKQEMRERLLARLAARQQKTD
jgi:uncharacterized protein (DUF433 family)